MRIGVPTEIKKQEFRVGLTPESVGELVAAGHEVAIQAGAGEGSGFSDAEYKTVGAKILPDADAVFAASELIVKVKEPQPEECARLTPAHTLFTYLHLAADPVQAEGLIKSGALPLKPAGVRIAGYFVSSAIGAPLFGFDISSPLIAGFDVGAFSTPL